MPELPGRYRWKARRGSTLRKSVTWRYKANEVQRVTVDATAGTFTLSFKSQITDAIAYDASAAAVQTALEGLVAVDSGDVEVTGAAGGPWDVEFRGQYASTDVEEMVAADVDLSGGGDSVEVETVQQGAEKLSVDLTGYVFRMQVRRTYDDEVVLELTTGNGGITVADPLTGRIDVRAEASDMEAFPEQETDPDEYFYDLEAEAVDGTVDALLAGPFLLRQEITHGA